MKTMKPARVERQTFILASVVVSLCAQVVNVLMATSTRDDQSGGARANWNDNEINALLDSIAKHKADLKETSNPKSSVFNSAADAVKPYHTAGPVKTAKQCQSKWQSMKGIYQAIEIYRNRSGCHWDNEWGANIIGDAEETVWSQHVAKRGHPLKPFRNKGWAYLEKFESILPSPGATGKHAFSATSAAGPSLDESDCDPPTATQPGQQHAVAPLSTLGSTLSSTLGLTTSSTLGVTPSSTSGVSGPSSSSHTDLGITGSDERHIDDAADNDRMAVDAPSVTSSAGKRKRVDIPNDPNSSNLTNKSSKPASAPKSSKKRSSARSGGTKSGGADSSNVGSSAAAASKISAAVAIQNMQGTINRLGDILEKSVSMPIEDSSSSRRMEAINLLQVRDDGLSTDQKSALVSRFISEPGVADAYVALLDDTIRQSWLQSILPV